MSKSKRKSDGNCDVLVIGSHCSASLAAAMLARDAKLRVTQVRSTRAATATHTNRLLLINPELLKLDPLLATIAELPSVSPTHGLRFCGESAKCCSEYLAPSVSAFVADEAVVSEHLKQAARDSGATVLERDDLHIDAIDEQGVDVSFGEDRTKPFRATMLIVSDELPAAARRTLGLNDHPWDPSAVHRYSFVRCKLVPGNAAKPLVQMSLDVGGSLVWAWMLPGNDEAQFCLMQSGEQLRAVSAADAMRRWIEMLIIHGAITAKQRPDVAKMQSVDLPLAGALSSEGVANRTLLIGPAGGFYTACAEETYPACWSAIFATDVARKALKEKHLQDALQSYRQKWGSTLGDYLRGPQQNLRFLLPLIYSNKVMAARMAEAILTGQSVVR